MEKCDTCGQQLVHNQHSDGVCGSCHDAIGRALSESTHKPICSEYWDRGLNCPCIPREEQERIASAIQRGDSIGDVIDPGWGQYD